MAIDTFNKRGSLVGLALPVPSVLPTADGEIEGADRLQLVWLYNGFVVSESAVTTISTIDLEGIYQLVIGLKGSQTLTLDKEGEYQISISLEGER